jgi:hypothetical protein
MIFNRILEDLGSDHVQAWHDIAGTAPERVGSGEGTASDQSRVLTAMKLLISFKDFDVYFRDRDGQCFMHYVAKDDGKVLEYMTNKGYNPLVRDRSGKTAWDIAKPKVSPDLIKLYVLGAYAEISEDILGVVQLQEMEDPSDKMQFSPGGFFSDDSSGWSEAAFRNAQKSLTENGKTVWVHLDVNDVSLSTTPSPQSLICFSRTLCSP